MTLPWNDPNAAPLADDWRLLGYTDGGGVLYVALHTAPASEVYERVTADYPARPITWATAEGRCIPEPPPHVHDWVDSPEGRHWCADGDSEYHDFPCDHPEEHAPGEMERGED